METNPYWGKMPSQNNQIDFKTLCHSFTVSLYKQV